MATVERVPADRHVAPEEWPTAAEQEFARRQAALAEHYDLDVESRVVHTDVAGRIHYLAAGDPDREPVLLCHGVGTTAATWIPLLPALADDYRCYVPDRPGRGLSAAPSYSDRHLRSYLVAYLLELLSDRGVDRPHVVGNSLGGLQAFLMAIDHDRVDRLCLAGAPGGVSGDLPTALRLTTVWGLNRLLLWLGNRGDPIENAREAMARFTVDTSAIPREFYAVMASGDRLPGRSKSLRSLANELGSWGRAHPLFDLRGEIVGIDRPTAFVWGEDDPLWPPSVGAPLVERMADARLDVLDDHGHLPWMEPGEETETAVRSFLDG